MSIIGAQQSYRGAGWLQGQIRGKGQSKNTNQIPDRWNAFMRATRGSAG